MGTCVRFPGRYHRQLAPKDCDGKSFVALHLECPAPNTAHQLWKDLCRRRCHRSGNKTLGAWIFLLPFLCWIRFGGLTGGSAHSAHCKCGWLTKSGRCDSSAPVPVTPATEHIATRIGDIRGAGGQGVHEVVKTRAGGPPSSTPTSPSTDPRRSGRADCETSKYRPMSADRKTTWSSHRRPMPGPATGSAWWRRRAVPCCTITALIAKAISHLPTSSWPPPRTTRPARGACLSAARGATAYLSAQSRGRLPHQRILAAALRGCYERCDGLVLRAELPRAQA
jgi:hypothetical protein